MAVNGGVCSAATFARILVLCTLALALHAAGEPLSIPPSQFWDGNDGPWSTFRVELGTPSQQVRLLPAHDQSSTWTIISEACGANDSECTDSRGQIFDRNKSSTWDQFGTYNTNPLLEERVGLKAPGLFGWDDLTLGWVGDNMPTLKNQSVVGITSKDFWIGSLAVNPRPINFTDYNNPIPSLMDNLFTKTNDSIPSLSWSYTAGAYNMSPKILGNLVLGGYDTTRFHPNSVSFPFGQDISLDFQVAVQSITTSLNSESLLNSEGKIIAYISTMVADIWLPTSVCQEFEKAFGLTWDSKSELYLLDSSLHQTLLEKNPSVRFTVGPETSGGAVAINMPYWSFYHTAKLDPTNSSSDRLYFPIKRAANDSQYVLGRTFLQNAHLSVDYHRQVFNLSQALYPSSSTEQEIVAVVPPPEQNSPGVGGGRNGGSEAGTASNGSLNAGVIAGIAVGIAVGVGVLALIAFIMYRRRKKAANMGRSEGSDIHMLGQSSGDQFKVEMGDGHVNEVAGEAKNMHEMSGQKLAEAEGNTHHVHEMAGQKLAEADGDTHHIHEMAGQRPDEAKGIGCRIHELPGEPPAELPADTPPTKYKHIHSDTHV